MKLTRFETELVALLLMRRECPTTLTHIFEVLYPDPDLEPDWAESTVSATFSRIRRKMPGTCIGRSKFGWVLERPGGARH